MALLQISNISHSFTTKVLHNIHIEVEEGEVVCLLGPSGSGKSTLLKLIAGLEAVQEGTILLQNTVIANSTFSTVPEKRNIGMVFQYPSLFPHLTIAQNIGFGGAIYTKSVRNLKVQALLEMMELNHKKEDYPHMLSGGEQQRVAIARALLQNPSLILLDEPFSSLDSSLRKKLRKETRHILKSQHIASIMVTHDSEEAMECADRIYMITEGQVVQEASPKAMYTMPNDKRVAQFFGNINSVITRIVQGAVVTPFGNFLIEDSIKQGDIEIVAREEAFSLWNDNSNDTQEIPIYAFLKAYQFLGSYSMIYFLVEGWDVVWSARIYKSKDLTLWIGKEIKLRLDETQLYFFPLYNNITMGS